jgi:hypothetical protein
VPLIASDCLCAPLSGRYHAKRLKTHVLNISHPADMRSDARTPDGPCRHFCFPGIPHHWAEMFLRLVESNVHGATDGLYY